MYQKGLIQYISFSKFIELKKESKNIFITTNGYRVVVGEEESGTEKRVILESEELYDILNNCLFIRLIAVGEGSTYECVLSDGGKIYVNAAAPTRERAVAEALSEKEILTIECYEIKQVYTCKSVCDVCIRE